MAGPLPLVYTWTDDGAFVPLQPKEADAQFVVGLRYVLKVEEERSTRSMGFYMAAVTEVWKNLPEAIAPDFPTADHLRKHALIRTGFYRKRSFVTTSPEEANAFAAFLRPIDSYAIVLVQGSVVEIYEAESQSHLPEPMGMGKERFEASKTATLAWIEDFLGWEPGTITPKTGKKAAAENRAKKKEPPT